MPETPISAAPGICFSESYYAVSRNNAFIVEGSAYRQGQNRWDNGYNVEFYAGYPQKIAGWGQATSSTTTGIPRCVITWRDNQANPRVAIGTETHLYFLLATTLTDITPLRTITTGTITNLITTTINSNLVVITDTAAQVQVGDWVFLSAAAAVGGVLLNNWYNVEAVSAGVSYTITAGATASPSAGPAGGTITYNYPRVTLGSNPFTTTNGSSTVKVTHTASGAAAGNFVSFSGATSVAGLTISGEYQITSIVDANHYDITASGNANTGTTGGGTAVSVIYPVPLQQVGFTTGVGYGNAGYSVGAYQGVGLNTNPSAGNGWTLAAYGNQLLSCPAGGTIYIYDPVIGGRSYPMLNAPLICNAMFVTPERFVVALGVNGAMQMAWCDQTDYTQWTTTNINTAETSRTITGGSQLLGGLSVKPGTSLFWSDRCCFAMVYNGGQYVYATQQIGDNCGLVSPTAMCSSAGIAYWMSDRDFFTYNGSVSPLPSDDVRQYVFGSGSLNTNYLFKATATLNRNKKQVRFYYPNGSMTENNVGMIFQFDTNCWSPLNFGRSCATDANLLANPISADSTKRIFTDESGTDANGSALAWSLQLGMADISNGDRNVDVFGFTPDFQSLTGSPSLTILTQYYPQIAVVSDGPYVLTTATTRQDLRSDGKLFGFSLSDNEIGSNFRLGTPRLDIQPSGARR